MKLIVGLGNPGREYENTRHNVGFQLLDVIVENKGLSFNRDKFNAKYCEYTVAGEKVVLIKPLSYMNLSGSVVAKFVSFYKISARDILVVQDDLDMNVGRIKIVNDSSSGGHNGIKDIERCLGTREYIRLKIGIANNKDVETKDYVLGNFSSIELDILRDNYKKLINIVDDFCFMSLDNLKSKYNHKQFGSKYLNK